MTWKTQSAFWRHMIFVYIFFASFMNVRAYTVLDAFWFERSRVKPIFRHLPLHYFIVKIVIILLVSLSKIVSFFEFLRTCNKCWAKYMVAYSYNLVENSAWDLWKLRRNFWNGEGPSFTNSFFSTLNNIIIHHIWPLQTIRSSSWICFHLSLNILQYCLTDPSVFIFQLNCA
jgi:hypothetical protein